MISEAEWEAMRSTAFHVHDTSYDPRGYSMSVNKGFALVAEEVLMYTALVCLILHCSAALRRLSAKVSALNC